MDDVNNDKIEENDSLKETINNDNLIHVSRKWTGPVNGKTQPPQSDVYDEWSAEQI